MAIKKATAFTASDGSMHATVEDAQRADMRVLMNTLNGSGPIAAANGANPEAADWLTMIADDLVEHAADVLEILTTGPRSRPAARKSKGTANPKRAAKAATPEQARKGFKAMHEAADAKEVIAHAEAT